MKPTLARRCITRGRVKASARKSTSGWSRLMRPMHHSQKGKALVCGLSTRKMRTPWSIQKRKTPSSASHSSRQASHSKSKGTMSSYFFGGFSAYWIEPSGRRRNHSGCSLTQGWSGDAWKAMSRAISMPRSRAASTSARKSSRVPRSGWMAVWPPPGRRWPRARRGPWDRRRRVLLGPLRKVRADGVDGRQVEHVEAHARPRTAGAR